MPCSAATRVISESLERRPEWHLRAAVRLHQLTCRSCRRFRRQLELLKAALARRAAGAEPPAAEPAATLSAEARMRIRQSLSEADGPSRPE